MKKATHPTYTSTVFTCNTCKKEYNLGSTVDSIRVELCANCHPFYTGKEMLVDTDNLVEKFNKKREVAFNSGVKVVSKKEKRQNRKKTNQGGALTLRDMLSQIK